MRIALRGADDVKRELSSIGPAGAQMGRQLDQAMRQPGVGLRALDASMASARGGITNMASSVGVLSAPLSALGPVGLAAGAGLAAAGAAAAVAFGQLRQAGEWAATLTDTADRVGVTTESLQSLRYVADETGVPIQALESGLERLNQSLGAFQSGVGDDRVKAAFERLGISREDLAGVQNATQLMPILADALSKVGSQAERVQLAKRLGVAELEPMLRRGSAALADMGAEGVAAGHVLSNDVIGKLDETDRALERNEQTIANNVRSMQANLAPFFVWASDWLAKLARGFTDLLDRGNKVEQRNDRNLARRSTQLEAPVQRAYEMSNRTGRPIMPWQRRLIDEKARIDAEIAQRARDRIAASNEPSAADRTPPPDAPDRPRSGSTSGGRRPVDNTAREAEAKKGREERVNDAIYRAKQDQLAAEAETTASLVQRQVLARERLSIEHEAQRAAQDRFIAEDEITEAKAGELRAALSATQAAEQRALAEDQRLARGEAMQAAQDTYTDVTRQILEASAASAVTADERRAIERQLLDIAHERLKADMRAQIAAAAEGEARERLVAAYNQLPALKAYQTQDINRRNAGPVERWREKERSDAANINDIVEAETLAALDDLNRGLIDALRNTDSAGDAFKKLGDVAVNALGRVVDALLEVALQRMLIKPLVDGLFPQGGGGGGGGGWMSLLANFAGNMIGARLGGGGGFTGGGGGGGLAGGGVYADGGLVGRRLAPGRITGPGGPRDDAILARVSNGEYIINARSTRAHFGLLEAINARPYADGGMVGGGMQSTPGFDATMPNGAAGVKPIINVEARVTVVNNGQPVNASQQMTPDGLALILDPIVKNSVAGMARTGELGRLAQHGPRMTKR